MTFVLAQSLEELRPLSEPVHDRCDRPLRFTPYIGNQHLSERRRDDFL